MIGDDDWILYSDQKEEKLSSENLENRKKTEKSKKLKKYMFMSSKLTTSQPDVKLVIKKFKNGKTFKKKKKRSTKILNLTIFAF